MGAESKKISLIAWVCAVFLTLFWSTSESLKVIWATSRHPRLPKRSIDILEPQITDFKRDEQRYFLEYGVYIPLEDMMFVQQLTEGGERYGNALIKSCSGLRPGSGFAIWLPLKTRWPLLGERVLEWCWKPPMQR